jgi:uncharacterized membrane-anchored protein YitT (DUF2179 family)/predicted metal-dependent HD superfamily phosphohydrolase
MENVVKKTVDFSILYDNIINQLEKNLPHHLTYHNAAHTIGVVEATEELAEAEGMEEEEKLLLRTAALFHDTGFLRTYKNHEEASCQIARETLPGHGYSPSQVDAICSIIMATKLPYRPADKLQQIICDADLHYLGTNQYFSTAEKLFNEFKKEGQVKTHQEWLQKQVLFLGAHRFFTETARSRYSTNKEEHLKALTAVQYKHHHQYLFWQDIVLLVFGVLIAGFGLEGFLVPNGFVDGGLTGISLLLHELYHFNLAITIILVNLPFIAAGYYSVNQRFAYKTLAAVILLGLCLILIPYPKITNDKLLISIFGGVFLGLGIGLTMRAGCALDGIEVLALYTLKRTSFTITEIIMGINIITFAIAAFAFGLERALYSILTYFAASWMIDYVIEGIQAFTGVTIISGESEIIKHRLVNELGRGITVYKGERGFLPGNFDVSANCDIIFTVVNRMELRKLKNLVYETDPKAFVFASTIREASGGIIKRRAAH